MLRDLDVTVPIFCYLTLTGVKGYVLALPQDYYVIDIHNIEKDNLILPEEVIENYDLCIEKILKPSFDLIWNACGLKGSFNYDEYGNWRDRT